MTMMIQKKKKHTDRIENLSVVDAPDHGVSYQVFSNVECDRIKISRSADGFRFHNSDRPAAIAVDGASYNLVMRFCETEDVGGDGLYVTKVDGALIENCKFSPPTRGDGDCCQFAYEKNDRNISKNILVRGCVMLQGDFGSHKGALILERTKAYRIENCWLGGSNFSLASTGDACVVRSNRMGDARTNDYSFGYGISERHHVSDHHVYDNVITNCRRGISLSGFGDRDVEDGGVSGYQRSGMMIHDNVISECDVGFLADRAWSGTLYRNIFMKCRKPVVVRGRGSQAANRGAIDYQIQGPIYRNDGTFHCTEAPVIRVEKGVAQVSAGRWSSEPDDLRYIWRLDGIDVPTDNRPRFHIQDGRELSCVVLARKGENWMLSIAERPWRDGRAGSFSPRSAAEGYIDWGNRYF